MDILLVDDNVDYLYPMKEALYAHGYTVYAADDGRQACRIMSAAKLDLIVSDIKMPEFDGIELIRWLTQERYQARVVAVTGYNPDYAKMAALIARAEGLLEVTTLSKPVPLLGLREALLAG